MITTHYVQYLEKVFGQLSEEQAAQFFENSQILTYETGDFLFKQGDTDNSLFLVLAGRLRVLHQEGNSTKILGDVSAGEPVGELALFTKEPRSASVVALRKSFVLQLKETDYLTLVEKFPSLAHKITHFIITRLRRNATNPAPKNIALVKLQPELDLSPWADDIRQQFGNMNIDIRVHTHNDHDNSPTFFDEIENHKGLNILVCDEQHSSWANQCMTYCDLVLVVTDFYAPSKIYAIEKQLKLYNANILNKKVYLLLFHPENAPVPVQTSRWLEGRNLDLHLHIRQHNEKDIRRFCRILTHQAIGLVLGGGGAKGFSHIGAAKALMEAGIEFDFVGGASAGALSGLIMSLKDFDMPQVISTSKMGAESKPTSNDYHFPFISLMSGEKMRKTLHEIFKDIHIEDLWIPCFTVSTNFTTASLAIHESGLARTGVEASIAIPGVFPPVIIDKHLHIDGAVMDNLPVETMYQKPVKHIIAISLNIQANSLVEMDKVPSAWAIFMNKMTKKQRFKLPAMSSILANSLTLNSVQKQARTKSLVSLYIEMDLRKFNFLDWSKWEALIEKGYQQTKNILHEMPEKGQFWK